MKFLISNKCQLIQKFFPSNLKKNEDKSCEKETSFHNNVVHHSFSLGRRGTSINQEQINILDVDPKETLRILNEIKTSLKKSWKE